MNHPGFFKKVSSFTLSQLAEKTGSTLAPTANGAHEVTSIVALDDAGQSDISFLDNRKYLALFETTKAGACWVGEKFADRAPKGLHCLISPSPYHSFASGLACFYPDSLTPKYGLTAAHIQGDNKAVHDTAVIGQNVTIEAGVSIGREAVVGDNTHLCSGSVIGYRCHIGTNSFVGPNVSIGHSLIGNNVIIHAGTVIGQDGFGFAMGPMGHQKVPQVGRVIIQDDVEIGGNTSIDRGALKDTIIGEGTKIDNQVQIGHNVVIGRHCVIVALTGISGSSELGDFVIIGGQVGVAGHLKIASGVQIAASSKVKDSILKAGRYGGSPCKPFMAWAREIAAIERLARKGSKG